MHHRFTLARLRSLSWTGGICSLLAACGDSPAVVPGADPGPLVADSTGLRIVHDTAPSWGTASHWVVADAPTLDLGEPEQAFLGVPAVVRLSDGRIVVADGATQAIRYFDAAGKLLATTGGRGAGEGEFHGLGWIGRGAADTVVAYDFVARRLMLFDGKGKFARAAELRPADPTVAAAPLASYPDGSVLFRLGRPQNPFPGEPGTVLRDTAAYMRFDLDGTPRVALGRFPQGQTFGVRIRAGQAPAPFPVPFGLTTVAAIRADTTLIGTGASFEIASFGPEGAALGILRAAILRPAVTPSEAEAYTDAAIARVTTGAPALKAALDSGLIQALRNAPFPEEKPAFGRLLVDRTGALWVSAPLNPPAAPTSWTVFAPDGTWLGTVTTPEGLRVDEVGPDYVLGVWRSRDGQERVRIYPLVRAAGS
jgi:hypothetical protein